jgi:hypothetical protein
MACLTRRCRRRRRRRVPAAAFARRTNWTLKLNLHRFPADGSSKISV